MQRLLLHHVRKLQTCCHILRHPDKANTDVQHRGRWSGAEPEIQRQKEPFLWLCQAREPDERLRSDSLLFSCRMRAEPGKHLAGRQEAVHIAETAIQHPLLPLVSLSRSRTVQAVIPGRFSTFLLPALAVQRLLAVFLQGWMQIAVVAAVTNGLFPD